MMLRYSPVDQVLNGHASVVCVDHKAPQVDLEEEEIAVICAVLEGINGEEDANAVVRLMRHFREPVPDFFSSEEFVRLYVQPGRFRLGDLSQEWKDWARRECFPQGSSAPPEKPQETDRKTLVTNEQMERGLARHFGVAPDEFISRVALLVDPPAGMPLKDLAFSCYKSDLCDSDCELVTFAIDLGASPTDKGRKVLEQQSPPGKPVMTDELKAKETPQQNASIRGRKAARDGGPVKDEDFKREVVRLIEKGCGDAEIARLMNEEKEDYDPEITAPKIRTVRRWSTNNPDYFVQKSGKKGGKKKK